MTTREALARDVGALAAGRALTSVVELVLALAIVRICSPDRFGALALLLGVAEVGRQLGAMGLPEAAAAFTARADEGAHGAESAAGALHTVRLVARATAVIAGSCVFAALVAVGHVAPLTGDSRALVADAAPFVALAVALDVVAGPLVQVLVARHRGRFVASLTAGASSVHAIGTLALAALGHLEALGVVWLAVATTRFVVARWAVARSGLLERAPTQTSVARVVRFAGPLALHAVSSKIHRQLDKVLVVALLGDVAGAAYGAVTIELPVLTAIPFAIGSVMLPRHAAHVARGDLDTVHAEHLAGIRKVALALVPTLVFLEVFAPLVVPTVLGDAYARSVLPFRIATLVSVQRVAHFGSVLAAFEDTATIARLSFAMVALDLLFVAPSTWWFGVVGATAASTAAALVVFVGYQLRIAQLLRRPLRTLFPFRALAIMALFALMACVPSAVLLAATGRGPLSLAAAAAAFVSTYLVAGVASGLVRTEDVRDLGRLVRFGGPASRGATS